MTVEELARELFIEVHTNLGHFVRDPNQFQDFDEVPPRKRAWIEIARVFQEGIVDGSPSALYLLVHKRLGDGYNHYPGDGDGRCRAWTEIARVLRARAWRPTDLAGMQVEAITLRRTIEVAEERLFWLDREQEALKEQSGLTEAQAERAAAFARAGQGAAAIAGLLREEAAAKGRQQAAEMEQKAAEERQERVNDGFVGGHGR